MHCVMSSPHYNTAAAVAAFLVAEQCEHASLLYLIDLMKNKSPNLNNIFADAGRERRERYKYSGTAN